jgi:5-(carboxyamino)imidazole ribonucleotide mutase
MEHAVAILTELVVPHDVQIISAHRTPQLLGKFATDAAGRGIEVIIAGAGGAAHLPGMVAAHTIIPVLGVPVASRHLNGLDSLLSIVQMPRGVPVGTLAIGPAGATNAALLAVAIVANSRPALRNQLTAWREQRTQEVMRDNDPRTNIAD